MKYNSTNSSLPLNRTFCKKNKCSNSVQNQYSFDQSLFVDGYSFKVTFLEPKYNVTTAFGVLTQTDAHQHG